MPMNRWQVISIHSFSREMSGYHFFQISEYLDKHNVWILGYKCIFSSKRKRSCFGKSPYVLFRKAPNVHLSELKLCDCGFPASISNNSLQSCKHIFSKVKSELPNHVEKNQVVQKTKKVKLSEDCQLCLKQEEDDGRLRRAADRLKIGKGILKSQHEIAKNKNYHYYQKSNSCTICNTNLYDRKIMEDAIKVEVKEEQIESENKFFNNSEGTEQLFISYEDVGNDIVKKELHEINYNYQYEDAEHFESDIKIAIMPSTFDREGFPPASEKKSVKNENLYIGTESKDKNKFSKKKKLSKNLVEKDPLDIPTHRKLKTFLCTLCDKMITQRNMKQHVSAVHEGKKEFQCDACDTPPFAYKSNLNRHKSDHCKGNVVKQQPQEMKCELCLTEFKDWKMLKSHLQEQHTAEGLYCCSHCTRKCKKFIGLKYHIDIKHPESNEKKFFCKQCNKGFIYNSSVEFHMSRDKCVKHKCELCGIEYRTLKAFEMHMAKNHNTEEETVLMCDKCDFSASHKLLLQHHTLTKHDIDKQKNCPCCDFKTMKTQKMYIHIDNKHPEHDAKEYVCDKCGESFIYKSSLKHHENSRCKLAVHNVCTNCDSRFPTIQGLKRHIDSVHKKLRPFKCTVCDQSFSRKNHMSVHMATVHEGQKPFRCDICETRFTSKSSLNQHVLVIHEKKKLDKCYKCSLCDSQFEKSSRLKEHITVVHEGQKFPCTICNKEFNSRSSLKVHTDAIHKDKNPFQCDICGKRFHNPSRVKKHIIMVHEKKCPYLCNNCDEGFLSKSLLQAHIKSLHKFNTILEPKIIIHSTTEKSEKLPELKVGTTEDLKSLEKDPLINKNHSVEFENAQINPRKKRITKQETVDYNVDPSDVHEIKFGTKEDPRNLEIDPLRKKVYNVDPFEVHELKFGTTEDPRSLEIDPLRNKEYSVEFENAQIDSRKRRIIKQETVDYNVYLSEVHKGKKLYKCPHCGESFKQRIGLRSHVQKQCYQRENFKCSVCEYISDSKFNLKIHLNTLHNGENGSNEDKGTRLKGTPAKICEHCGRSFEWNYRLKRHVASVHEGKRQIRIRCKRQCNICGKSVSQLKGHIRAVHDKVKPFVCSICGYKCGKQHQLNQHMEWVHDEIKVRPIQCSQCAASFKNEPSLIKHVKLAHENLSGLRGKQLGCPFCSGIITGKRGFIDHVELEHPNWINSFKNKMSLLRHVLLQSSNSQNINGSLETKQENFATPVDSEKIVKAKNVKSQEYTDRKSFKTKKGETVVVLSLEEKAKLIADSKKPGFSRKEVVAKYGININTITNILKNEDKIKKIIESGQKQVIPRVRLSLQVKAKLIEESKQPGFNKKEAAARYRINIQTLINILSNQDKVLKLIESGLGHKTNTNFGKEQYASNSDKITYQYRNSSHHRSIQK